MEDGWAADSTLHSPLSTTGDTTHKRRTMECEWQNDGQRNERGRRRREQNRRSNEASGMEAVGIINGGMDGERSTHTGAAEQERVDNNPDPTTRHDLSMRPPLLHPLKRRTLPLVGVTLAPFIPHQQA